jgi:diguanylate cyclase (GGDEF)-like protein/PAS domain S-box-containing protein
LKSLERLIDAITELGFSEQTKQFFVKNREFIIEMWCHSAATTDIIEHLEFEPNQFREEVATPVYNYLYYLLEQQHVNPECATMRMIVRRFYDIGLSVEEIYINCTTLKNTINRAYDERGKREIIDEKHKVLMLLDYSLYGVIGIYTEIIQSLNRELRERNTIIEENVPYIRVDLDGIILEATEAFSNLSGYIIEELKGKHFTILQHPELDADSYQKAWETIQENEEWKGQIYSARVDGTTFIAEIEMRSILSKNQISSFLIMYHDITLAQASQLDSLTNLYNRRAFDTKSLMLFTDSLFRKEQISIIMFDIDHFKNVNDQYGHMKGDEILQSLSKVLKEYTRINDVVARWGGEEFVVILPQTNVEQASEIAERIRNAFEMSAMDKGIVITCSCGIAEKNIYDTLTSLLQRADSHLYNAKTLGRNRIVCD